jgi:hypothetical protein
MSLNIDYVSIFDSESVLLFLEGNKRTILPRLYLDELLRDHKLSLEQFNESCRLGGYALDNSELQNLDELSCPIIGVLSMPAIKYKSSIRR